MRLYSMHKENPMNTIPKGRSLALALTMLGCAGQAEPSAPTPPVAVETPTASVQVPSLPQPAHDGPATMGFAGVVDQAVTSFGAAATATHLYTLGGYSGTPHHYVKEHQSDRFARMDLTTGAWETLSSPDRSQGATLSEYRGKIYRVAGMRIDNAEGEETQLRSLDTFAVYDPQTAEWASLPPLPEARSSHEATFVGSELYVVGGWDLDGDMSSGTWHTTMLVADVEESPIQWRSIEMPFKARALGAASLGKRLYVIGGIVGRAPRNSVNVYDTEAGTWSEGPRLEESGFGLRAATMGGRLYASGVSGNVLSLNAEQTAWEMVGELTFGRMFHQVAPAGERGLLFVGGIPAHGKGERVRHIEQLHYGPKQQRAHSWVIDSEMSAKNRQGIFLVDNRLYFFGGNNSLGQHDFAKENFVADGYRLDLGALSWSKLPDFPRPRQSMQTLVTKAGEGIAVGGFGMAEAGLATRPELFRYNFENREWMAAEKGLPESRTQFGLVEHGGRLWVFGGLDFDGAKKGAEQFVHPTSVLTADLAHLDGGFVDAGIVIPRPRRAFAGALVDGKYYLVGGMAAGFELVHECDVYDFETKTWAQSPPPPNTRIGAEAVSLGGKLYLIAGRSKKTKEGKLEANDSIDVFDPATGSWSTLLEQLPIEDTHQLRALPFKDKLLLFSSQREDGKAQMVLVDTK